MLKDRIRTLAVTGITITAAALVALSATAASAATAGVAHPRHAVGTAIAVHSTAAAPAAGAVSLPTGLVGITADAANTNPLYYLHAHAHNEPVDTSSNLSEFQNWDFIRPVCVYNLSDVCQPAVEIELAPTGECLNAQNAADGVQVWLDSCQSTYDQNEYFWYTYLGPGNYGDTNWWFINVYDSVHYHQYSYLTASSLGDDRAVCDFFAGEGNLAVWSLF